MNYTDRLSKNTQISNLINVRPVGRGGGANCSKRTDGQTRRSWQSLFVILSTGLTTVVNNNYMQTIATTCHGLHLTTRGPRQLQSSRSEFTCVCGDKRGRSELHSAVLEQQNTPPTLCITNPQLLCSLKVHQFLQHLSYLLEETNCFHASPWS